VGTGSGSPQVALSSNGGQSWNTHYGASDNQSGGSVAYSADADTILWSTSNSGVLRSQHQSSFAAVASLPSGAAVAADRRNNSVFYAGSGSKFYRSTDTGVTFTSVSLPSGVQSVKDVVAHPVVSGEVWVSTNAGLFRSTDFGATFSAVSTLTDTEQIAFGKGDGSAWNVYAFGQGPSGAKLYASSDSGASWVDIQGTKGFGAMGANRVVGSGNVANQVYVGTNGRGVFYAKVSVPSSGGSPSTTSSAVSSTKTTSSVPTTLATSTVRTTTTSTSTVRTSSTTTTSSAPTTTTPTQKSKHWEQCGGLMWTGPTVCEEPWTCVKYNDWYSQCV